MTLKAKRQGWGRPLAVVLVAVAALAGCSGGGKATPSPSRTGAVSSFTERLKSAENNGDADETQLKALRAAEAKGSMSYEELDALINGTIACFESSGVDYRRVADRELAPGLMFPGYTIGGPIEVGDKCVAKYSGYAELAYQSQPSAVEARDAKFEAARPKILACLREHSVVIDDEATADEVERAAVALHIKTLQSTNDEAVQRAAFCMIFAM